MHRVKENISSRCIKILHVFACNNYMKLIHKIIFYLQTYFFHSSKNSVMCHSYLPEQTLNSACHVVDPQGMHAGGVTRNNVPMLFTFSILIIAPNVISASLTHTYIKFFSAE
jgi:hypothetical protein